MSSIAAPSRTDGERFIGRDGSLDWLRLVRLCLAAGIFSLLLISFTPFVLEYDVPGNAGNLVNQLGYTGLGVVAIAGHFLFTDRSVALSLLRPAWIVMLGMLFFAASQSAWSDSAFRAVLFTTMAMVAATGAVCLPANVRDFRVVLATAALAVLGLSYAGIVLYPAAAIHDATGPEAIHAGLWRGIYSHKNVAGPIMAMLFFAGLYLVRSGNRKTGLLVAALSAFFIYKTGSKTTLALVPVVACIVVGGRLFGGRVLPAMIVAAAVAVTGLLTLGAAISPQLNDVLQTILPGTTFTGRLDLWRFTLDQLSARPWTGFGYESFWDTPNVFRAELPFELSWDPRGIVNSHSSYLDLVVWGGWATLIVALFPLIILPLKDFISTRPTRENTRLSDLFLMILAFALLNSFLETYFFSRANPIWMFTWISIVGLRLSSRFDLEPPGCRVQS